MKIYYLTAIILMSMALKTGIAQTELDLEERKARLILEPPSEKIYNLLDKKFPEHTLNMLNDTNLAVSDLIGKRTIINFWFTNCQPCLDEIPVLNEIKYELDSQEYNFIAITFQDSSEINLFLESTEYNFSHVTNARSLIDLIGVRFYPKTVILNKDLDIIRIEKRMPADANDAEIEVWKQDILNTLKSK